jgi:hypothetical protein
MNAVHSFNNYSHMRYFFLIILLFLFRPLMAQEESGSLQFWNSLKNHCGKAYEGELLTPGNDDFAGKKLVMHVRTCEDNTIRIPFFVGDDRSRTWVLTLQDDLIKLKHDHRHEDGSEDDVTQYGGISTNTGLANIQFFPADQETADLIAYASTNVWWITLDETSFSYNLRRMGSDRLFTVKFDLTREVAIPPAPWGSD